MKTGTLTTLCLLGLLAGELRSQSPSLEWAQSAGTPNIVLEPLLATDATGNVYACGTFTSTVDFDPGAAVFNLTSNGANDIFIQKLDAAGNFVWAKNLGGSTSEQLAAFTADASGNCYLTGTFYGTVDFDPGAGTFNLTPNGLGDYFILKLNSSGSFQWAQGGGSSNSVDGGVGVKTDAAGNVFATGIIFGVADLDAGSGVANTGLSNSISLFILKLDANGNFVWAKANSVTGGSGGFGTSYANSILVDMSSIYVGGHFNGTVDFDPGSGTNNITSAGNNDIFVQKLDLNGNLVWITVQGSTGDDRTVNILQDAGSNICITGTFSQTVDFDPGAGTFQLTAPANSCSFIQKITASAGLLWAKALDVNIYGGGAAMDSTGNLYLTGFFINTADFDPGSSVLNFTSAGSTDYFIQKFDGSGNSTWARTFGSTMDDEGYYTTLDFQNDIIVSGIFTGTVDFDPNSGTSNLASVNSSTANNFIHKLDQGGVGIAEPGESALLINVYPNPSSGTFTVQSADGSYQLINGSGAVVEEFVLNGAQQPTHTVTNLAPGVYFLRGVTTNGQPMFGELIVAD